MKRTSPADVRLRFVLLVVGAVLWGVVVFWLWAIWNDRRTEENQPPPLPQVRVPAFQPYELPDFHLTDQLGRPVSKSTLLGRRWVASFIFTRCTGQCPLINRQMQRLQELVQGTDVVLVSITVDPAHDTPSLLRSFAQRHQADPNRWLFLTGTKDEVYRLVRGGFRLSAAENTGEQRTPGQEFTHSPRLCLVDETGRVVGSYLGTDEVAVARLHRRLRRDSRRRKQEGTEASPKSKQTEQRRNGT